MQTKGHLNLLELNLQKAIIAYVDARVAELTAANGTSITNLNAWAAALATKLNADAGVTDTNYDTNPQA
jgi:hypothetical protein